MNIRAATQTTHLGRYHVVKRLAAGGMADVLLARTDGIEGFQRHVVIKRIHAELLEEQRYVKMFLDEARLAASLHHHNIVQVNDIGEQAGEYFFAMEYVHGEDVRTLLIDASQRGELIPLEHVITIVTAAAAGLHHAHEQRGMDGTPLGIVHRDVSPANILVGYDGAVKVADFGIALASHRAEHTQSGVLKGKVAYMSPEQCNCDPVDRRSDVFSLGIVLYELVTVRPCFAGDNDFMTMSAIVGGKVQPASHFRSDLPPALEAIIMKALARDAATRYQSADELRSALEELAATLGLRTSTNALADYMKKRFGTKALPWQADDANADPDIVVGADDGVSVPRAAGRVLTPAPGGVLVATPRQRTPAVTVPLRPIVNPSLASGDDDDLAIPVDNTPVPPVSQRKGTLPMHSLSPRVRAQVPDPPSRARAPGNVVVVDVPTPVNDEVSVPTRVASPRAASNAEARAASHAEVPTTLVARLLRVRQLWLAGSIAAVAIAAVALIVVTSTGGSSARAARPRSTPTTPAAVHVQAAAPEPVAPATLVHEAPPPVAAPAKRARKPAVKKEAKPSPTKKWDPDALFPQ